MDPILTLKTFVAVVAFIILFEYMTEILEYLLEESYAYSKMLQVIYKELMLMGVISFGIIMFEAANESHSQNTYDTIVAIDFAHIILFYLTIFFVVHAFYLIRISIFNYRKYRHYFAVSLTDLAERAGILAENPCSIANILFRSDFVLLSSLRDKVEFKMVQSVFNALYLVPKNFNYPAYIAGCYGRYALKTINRTFMSWMMFLLVIIVNFLRLYVGYSCTIHQQSAAHRYLTEEDILGGGSSYGGSTYGGGTYGSGSHAGGSGSHHYSEDTSFEDENCRKLTIREFLAAGAMVVVYNVVLLIVSRIYKLRLVHMAGTEGSHEFKDFLAHIHNHEQQEKATSKIVHRFTTKRFLNEITKEMATSEHCHDDEEEEEFVHRIGNFVKKAARGIREWMAYVRMHLRVCMVTFFCPERKAKIDKARSGKSVFENTNILLKRRANSGEDKHERSPPPSQTNRSTWHSTMQDMLLMNKKKHHKKHELSIRDRIRVDFHRPLPLTKAHSMHLDETDLDNIMADANENKMEEEDKSPTAILRNKSRMLEAMVQAQMEESNMPGEKKKSMSQLPVGGLRAHPPMPSSPPPTDIVASSPKHYSTEESSTADPVTTGIEMMKNGRGEEKTDSAVGTPSPSSSGRQPIPRLKSATSMNPCRVRLPEGAVMGNKSPSSVTNQQQRRQVVSVGRDDSPSSSLSNSIDDDDDDDDEHENIQPAIRSPGSRVNLNNPSGGYEKVGIRFEDVELGLRMEQTDGYGSGDDDDEEALNEEVRCREMYLMCPVRSFRSQRRISSPGNDDVQLESAGGAQVDSNPKTVFDKLYFFHSPEIYAWAIEFGIMVNCLFMAVWVTNMITISKDVNHDADYEVLAQLAMVVPILTTFYMLPFITETASLLIAISELNLGVVKKVLENTVETAELVREVRREVMECSGELEVLNPERLDNLHYQYQAVLSEMQLINSQILKYQAQLSLTNNRGSAAQRSRRTSLSHVDSATLTAAIADMERLRAEKHQSMTELKTQIDNFASEGRKEFIAALFAELDRDGSGFIDRDEFRELLRKLELTYNNHKFKMLFRAIDGDDGNGLISEDELTKFLFPTTHSLIEDIDQAIVNLDQHTTHHNDLVYQRSVHSSSHH